MLLSAVVLGGGSWVVVLGGWVWGGGSVGVGLGWWFWGGGSGGWFFGVFLEWVSEMVLGWFLREIICGGFGVGL